MFKNPLLEAILADPDDVPLRLVYSDWLEENADSGSLRAKQAELIRVQMELERLWPGYSGEPRVGDWAPDPRCRELALRAKELAQHFTPSRRYSLRCWIVRRGFLDELAFGFPVLDRAGPLCWDHPIRHLRLSKCRGRGAQLAEFEPLARLRTLELGTLDPPDLVALAKCTHLAGLRGLGLHGQTRDDVRLLLSSGHLQPIVALSLGPVVLPGLPTAKPGLRLFIDSSYNDIDATSFAALVDSGVLKDLQELHVLRGPLGDEVVHALTRKALPAITHLVLNAYPRITTRGLVILAGLPHLAGLKTLSLDGVEVCDEGARALASSPHLAGLRILSLRYSRIGDEGGRALADSPSLQHVERLDLRSNRFSIGVIGRLKLRFGARVQLDSWR